MGYTPYQQDSILVTYATDPERALTLLDSALLLGNISEYRGLYIRAKIYGKSLEELRIDSAIIICDRFNISRHTLNDLLAEHAGGLSFPQYINAIRLQEALRLLRDEPAKTVAAIATEIGLSSANLREQFKRKYGITPVEYRQNMNI